MAGGSYFLTEYEKKRIIDIYLETHSIVKTAQAVHRGEDAVRRTIRSSPECMKIRLAQEKRYPLKINHPRKRQEDGFDPVAAGLCRSFTRHYIEDADAYRVPKIYALPRVRRCAVPAVEEQETLRITRRVVNLDTPED